MRIKPVHAGLYEELCFSGFVDECFVNGGSERFCLHFTFHFVCPDQI